MSAKETTPHEDQRAMEALRKHQFCLHLHVDGFHVYAAGNTDHGEPLAVDADPAIAILLAAAKMK